VQIPKDKIVSVGILGGGQLARMMAQSAVTLGLHCRVFTNDLHPPAELAGVSVSRGSFKDSIAVRAFLSSVRLVTFENEFLDCQFLREAAKDLAVRFVPDLKVIELIQDKLQQKIFLKKNLITTAEFEAYEGKTQDALMPWVASVQKRFGQVVFKWARQGYDGKGVLITDERTPTERISAFCKQALESGNQIYAEKKIFFRRELAVVASFSTQNEFMAYPLVISEQKEGVCYRVYGPARSLGVQPWLEAAAHEAASKIAVTLQLHGTFAIEFFEDPNGGLLVNEIAPRVHNTGHYTIDACRTSQFENHWRAVLGMRLAPPEPAPVFAMLNLLGPDSVEIEADSGLAPQEEETFLKVHWYGKKEIRPRRKLGHINAISDNVADLDLLLTSLEKSHDHWVARLQSMSKGKKG